MAFLHLVCLFALAVFAPQSCDAVATASIDFGSEWMKIGLVKPGVPMEIVLNTESQRKTAVGVSLSNGERLFADFAVNNCVKDPLGSYRYILPLIGQKADSAAVKQFLMEFPHYNITAHETRGTVVFTSKSGSRTIEELVAMILEYAVELATKSAEQPVTSVVLTVPPFFTQAQRKTMLLAGQIANINIVQLLNTNTAVAINYGVFRRSEFTEVPQYVLFVDMGAGSTTATVVAYSTATKGKKSKTSTASAAAGTAQLEILGVGFNATLGGLQFDEKLSDFLLDKFIAKTKLKKNPRDDGRATAKFLKEASRVKKILSANVETYAQIENVFEGHDFRVLVTRAEFEGLVGGLYDGVLAPVQAALAAADLTPDQLTQSLIVGGSTRIPRVQTILQGFLGKELGKGINADEAAAMGAAYQAAVLSKGFRVKEFIVKDVTAFPIDVEYARSDETGNTLVNRSLYSRGNPQPQKKMLTFNHKTEDFTVKLHYGDLSFLSEHAQALLGGTDLLTFNVTNVTATLESNAENIQKGIKAHFRLDESGIFHLENTEAVFEIPVPESEEKTEETAEATDGADTKKDDAPEGEKPTEEGEGATTANTTDTANATAVNGTVTLNATNSTANVTLPPKPKPVKVRLPVEVAVHDIVDIPAAEVQSATDLLRSFATAEAEKRETEAAKNALEAFIYITRDRITTDEVISVSTDAERSELESQLNTASLWLEEEGFDAATGVYRSQLMALNKTARPIFYRLSERVDRPEALARLAKSLNMTAEFTAMARNTSMNVTGVNGTLEEPWIKEGELEALLALANETSEWVAALATKQALLKDHEDPVLKSSAVRAKVEKLDRELVYLIRRYNARPKPKPKIPKFNSTGFNTTDAKAKNKTKTKAAPADDTEAPVKEESKEESFAEDTVSRADSTEDSTASEDEKKTPEPEEHPTDEL